LQENVPQEMTQKEFEASLTSHEPPPSLSPLLRALWYDARGDWDKAHHIAQDVETSEGAWIHGYLHRKEGDLSNARYWYRRANQPEASDSLESEWQRIVSALLT
jgi:hypothetical protein